jgi:O-antigen/teichoic acid export membrane protein
MVISLALGIAISVLNTRMLGEKQFGDLKFLQNLFALSTTMLNLGLFSCAGRLVLFVDSSDESKAFWGNSIVVAAGVAVVEIVLLLAYSFAFQAGLYSNIGRAIIIFAPFIFVFPMQNCFENLMQGENLIHELAVLRTMPQALFLAGLLALNLWLQVSLFSTIAVQLLGLLLVLVYFCYRLKPEVRGLVAYWRRLLNENKNYGFPVYVGSIAGVASAQFGALLLAYLVDTANLGFFSLAVTITLPLTMIPSVVGTTFFRDYAESNRVSRNATTVTIFVCLLSLLIFFLFIKDVFGILYSREFSIAVNLSYIVCIGAVLHGFGDYYNRFLGAHGKGKELRNGAIAVGATNLFGYSGLVLAFGVRGAAVTRLVAGGVYFFTMFFSYRRFCKRVHVV